MEQYILMHDLLHVVLVVRMPCYVFVYFNLRRWHCCIIVPVLMMAKTTLDEVLFSIVWTQIVLQGFTEKRKVHTGYAILE